MIPSRCSGCQKVGRRCRARDDGIEISKLGGMNLRKQSLLFVTLLAIPAVLAASSPKLLLSWKNPNYSGGHFTNILVLALNGKAENRAQFEDELVTAIARPGIQATQSYVFLPRPNVTPLG